MGKIKKLVKKIISSYCSKRLHLPKGTIIYSTKNVHNLSCGQHCWVGTKNSFLVNVSLGDFSYTTKDSSLYGLKVGKFSCLGPGIAVIAGEHPTHDFVSVHPAFYSLAKQCGFTLVNKQKFEEYRFAEEGYNFTIGNDVWVGSHVLLIEGHSIGDGAIVAAGSVVTKNITPLRNLGRCTGAFHPETFH